MAQRAQVYKRALEFEQRIADLLRREGFKDVKTNVRIQDIHGNYSELDVVARRRSIISRFFTPFIPSNVPWGVGSVVVECKNYKGHLVPLEDVAKFKSVLELNAIPSRHGLFVTSSEYTPRARTLGIRTLDGKEVEKWDKLLRWRYWLFLGLRSVTSIAALVGIISTLIVRYTHNNVDAAYLPARFVSAVDEPLPTQPMSLSTMESKVGYLPALFFLTVFKYVAYLHDYTRRTCEDAGFRTPSSPSSSSSITSPPSPTPHPLTVIKAVLLTLTAETVDILALGLLGLVSPGIALLSWNKTSLLGSVPAGSSTVVMDIYTPSSSPEQGDGQGDAVISNNRSGSHCTGRSSENVKEKEEKRRKGGHPWVVTQTKSSVIENEWGQGMRQFDQFTDRLNHGLSGIIPSYTDSNNNISSNNRERKTGHQPSSSDSSSSSSTSSLSSIASSIGSSLWSWLPFSTSTSNSSTSSSSSSSSSPSRLPYSVSRQFGSRIPSSASFLTAIRWPLSVQVILTQDPHPDPSSSSLSSSHHHPPSSHPTPHHHASSSGYRRPIHPPSRSFTSSPSSPSLPPASPPHPMNFHDLSDPLALFSAVFMRDSHNPFGLTRTLLSFAAQPVSKLATSFQRSLQLHCDIVELVSTREGDHLVPYGNQGTLKLRDYSSNTAVVCRVWARIYVPKALGKPHAWTYAYDQLKSNTSSLYHEISKRVSSSHSLSPKNN